MQNDTRHTASPVKVEYELCAVVTMVNRPLIAEGCEHGQVMPEIVQPSSVNDRSA
jgi:hypothetical protein